MEQVIRRALLYMDNHCVLSYNAGKLIYMEEGKELFRILLGIAPWK